MTDKERIDKAVELILNYGGIDGSHHKQWVLDQTLRTLLGDKYDEAIDEAEDCDDEIRCWETGIAP